MKKTSLIFVYVLLSVFCFSSVSYSDRDFDVHWTYRSEELRKNADKTFDNHKDFENIMTTTKSHEINNLILLARIKSISHLLFWSNDLTVFFNDRQLHYSCVSKTDGNFNRNDRKTL